MPPDDGDAIASPYGSLTLAPGQVLRPPPSPRHTGDRFPAQRGQVCTRTALRHDPARPRRGQHAGQYSRDLLIHAMAPDDWTMWAYRYCAATLTLRRRACILQRVDLVFP